MAKALAVFWGAALNSKFRKLGIGETGEERLWI